MFYASTKDELSQYLHSQYYTVRPSDTHFTNARRAIGWPQLTYECPTNRQLAYMMDLCRELRIFPSQEAYRSADTCRQLIRYLTDRSDWDDISVDWERRFVFTPGVDL